MGLVDIASHVIFQQQLVVNGAYPHNYQFTKIRDDTALIFFVGCTAIKLNAVGAIKMASQLDAAGGIGFNVYSANFGPNEHRALPAHFRVDNGFPAGVHTYRLVTNDVNTGSNVDDNSSGLVLEVLTLAS